MGTFLTAFDNGYISKFSGKSLDEIACEDIYSNDDDDNDDDDDVGKERARKKKTGPKPSKLPTGKSTRVLFQSICHNTNTMNLKILMLKNFLHFQSMIFVI
uniref:Uncharacterized protein n=1 Tax=Magallana gigas TaxID=29159 RepID=A0A8W8LWA5_MAGGI